MSMTNLGRWIVTALFLLPGAAFAGEGSAEVCNAAPAPGINADASKTVALRVRFGLKDTEPTDWSGKISVSEGKVAEVRGWRWTPTDAVIGNAAWKVSSVRQSPADAPAAPNNPNRKLPINDSGIVVCLEGAGPEALVQVDTAPGKAEFKLGDLPYGKRLMELTGGMEIERVPAVTEAAATSAEEDYPAAVLAKDGTTYLAYLTFVHGKDFVGPRERPAAFGVAPLNPLINPGLIKHIDKPADLDYLREPTGGEQLYLRPFKDGKFATPIPVTDGSVELYRPAVAIDGDGKVWVFYSAHLHPDADGDYGDWELMARAYDPAAGKFGEAIDLSNAPGSDFFPAAATDSTGRVWVTWVGGRAANFSVFATHQTGHTFAPAARLTKAAADEWEPAIAADKNGNVTVAWDTYQKGDYDIYMAKAGPDGAFGAPAPVAATLGFEVRPSLAYDGAGRLWIAYEESGNLWGKDFGALKKKGIPLYSGMRSLGIKVLAPDGKWFQPPDVASAIGTGGKGQNAAGPAAGKAGNGKGKQGLGQVARARSGVAPCFPRLAADDQGHVWLAFRGRQSGNLKVGVGSVWFEFLTRLEGDHWLAATWIPRSNNILDNRPSLVVTPAHDLLVFFSGDGRGELVPHRVADPHNEDVAAPGPAAKDEPAPAGVVGSGGNQNAGRNGRRAVAGPDPNDDLFLASFHADATGDVAPALTPIAADAPAAPPPDVEAERQAVQAARDYRYNVNGQTLQLSRGEFHRHTELSPDGGGDGGLLDMWRYAIDAASLDWIGDGDHDYGNGREYSWWTTQKAVTLFTLPGHFVPMYCYERSVVYPEGHRNCLFARRGVRSLPRLPLSAINDDKPAPDTLLLYQYLHHFDGVCAAHTTATSMGTDWRNNDPEVEPFVEIFQGDRNSYERPDAPRSAVREAKLKQSTPEEESFGGYRPKGFVNLALLKGYRLAFESSSDHISTHLSYCNVLVTEPTRQGVLDAIRKRHVYGSTDNMIADVRVKSDGIDHIMGDEFSTDQPPTLNVKLIGALPLMNVTIVKDDEVVYTADPKAREAVFLWTDPHPTSGKTSYYYVRGEQVPDVEGATGEIVWASPMWIKYTGK